MRARDSLEDLSVNGRVIGSITIGRGKLPSKNTTINMAKMMVFIAEQNKKLHVSAYIGHHQVCTTSC
jgi:hypothetical protein